MDVPVYRLVSSNEEQVLLGASNYTAVGVTLTCTMVPHDGNASGEHPGWVWAVVESAI